MPTEHGGLKFAGATDMAIPYIARSRDYYLAKGYPKPYRWAHLAEVPFATLEKPINKARIAVITTAAPITPGHCEQGPGAPFNGAAAFEEVYSAPSGDVPELGISHLAYDRDHTSGADRGAFFALPALAEAVTAGRVGAVAARFHGTPNRYNQSAVLEKDAPELLARLRQDKADAVILAAV